MMDSLPFSKSLHETRLAIKAATNAAEAIMKIYHQDFSSSLKENNEPITEADITSNQIITNELSALEYPILSEESSDDIKKRIDSERVWIVDPLDGTMDFVNKTGEFTVMIGLVENRQPIIGIICVPSNKTVYVAQKKGGAFQLSDKDNWKKLHVSNTSELTQCQAIGSRFHQSDRERSFLQSLGIKNFTSRGSSLKITDICLGNADAYLSLSDKMKQWDTCASYCLVTEAGGKMTDMAGQDLKYNTEILNHQNGILVTNGLIHKQITNRYEEFLKTG